MRERDGEKERGRVRERGGRERERENDREFTHAEEHSGSPVGRAGPSQSGHAVSIQNITAFGKATKDNFLKDVCACLQDTP